MTSSIVRSLLVTLLAFACCCDCWMRFTHAVATTPLASFGADECIEFFNQTIDSPDIAPPGFTTTFDECCMWCGEIPQCKAAVFDPETNRCHPKNSTTVVTNHTNPHLIVVKRVPSTPSPNAAHCWYLPQHNITSPTLATVTNVPTTYECCVHCSNYTDGLCAAAVYDSASYTCHLKATSECVKVSDSRLTAAVHHWSTPNPTSQPHTSGLVLVNMNSDPQDCSSMYTTCVTEAYHFGVCGLSYQACYEGSAFLFTKYNNVSSGDELTANAPPITQKEFVDGSCSSGGYSFTSVFPTGKWVRKDRATFSYVKVEVMGSVSWSTSVGTVITFCQDGCDGSLCRDYTIPAPSSSSLSSLALSSGADKNCHPLYDPWVPAKITYNVRSFCYPDLKVAVVAVYDAQDTTCSTELVKMLGFQNATGYATCQYLGGYMKINCNT